MTKIKPKGPEWHHHHYEKETKSNPLEKKTSTVFKEALKVHDLTLLQTLKDRAEVAPKSAKNQSITRCGSAVMSKIKTR
ncbi:MAG: hypothetical protein EBU93_03340 [Chlamydiae bacterium]|nr:hypothetical protein [Chlamydiota bacterium]